MNTEQNQVPQDMEKLKEIRNILAK